MYSRDWPDSLDVTTIGFYVLMLLGLPTLGYALMVIDVRAYLRAMRRALVRVSYHFPTIPQWARQETPQCLRALGLSLPCTIADVKRAYHRRAERLHPDRGGDRRTFHVLQRDFEAALTFLRDCEHQEA